LRKLSFSNAIISNYTKKFNIFCTATKQDIFMTTLGGGGPLSSRSALVADSTPPSPSSRESTDDVSPGGGGGGGTIKILINGVRKIYYAPVPPPPEDNAPPAKRPVLEWVFGYRGADQASLANCRNFARGTSGKIIVYRMYAVG
jgi:hypothetical protein